MKLVCGEIALDVYQNKLCIERILHVKMCIHAFVMPWMALAVAGYTPVQPPITNAPSEALWPLWPLWPL